MTGYTEITVEVPCDHGDTVADFLLDNILCVNCLAIEENGGQTILRLYIVSDRNAQFEITNAIEKYLVDSGVTTRGGSVSFGDAGVVDWITAFCQWDIIPITVGGHVINIEPGAVFGSGKHETTMLCMDALCKCVRRGDRVLDFGTGSGVLAILAAKLGATEVLGLDIDVDAVNAASRNVAINNVSDKVTIALGSTGDVLASRYYDVVVANLLKETIVELFDDFIRAVKPGGSLILSGIQTFQISDMEHFFRGSGYPDFTVTTRGEWGCILVPKPL